MLTTIKKRPVSGAQINKDRETKTIQKPAPKGLSRAEIRKIVIEMIG